MFTRNFYTRLFSPTLVSIATSYAEPKVKTTSGTYVSMGNLNAEACRLIANQNSSYENLSPVMNRLATTGLGGIIVGSGNTEPTFDDYTLENPFEKAVFTLSGVVTSFDYDEIGVTLVSKMTLTNATQEEKTISEIGLVTVYNSYEVLCERTVLAEPITIAAGEKKRICYTVTFNYPTA